MIEDVAIVARKPLGGKAYGSIPHLPGSRLGPGDHHISGGQVLIATEKVRDKHDVVICQEKLDGSCCSVAKVDGVLYALTRKGYKAHTSEYVQHHYFDQWVKDNAARFDAVLDEGERIVGEWLAQACGTIYKLPHEPFVAFDIMKGGDRVTYDEFAQRVQSEAFTVPRLIGYGAPVSLATALAAIEESGHGATEAVEGAVWRVERKGRVDFLCKYVRHDKQDGKYMIDHEPIWHWKP